LLEAGAIGATAYVTHGVLSGGAVARVDGSALTELVITDSIASVASVKAAKKIRRITIAPLLAEAMRRTSEESSVSSLFD
jgi:ribose-phosphate pyrophosphokinase